MCTQRDSNRKDEVVVLVNKQSKLCPVRLWPSVISLNFPLCTSAWLQNTAISAAAVSMTRAARSRSNSTTCER